MQYDKPIEDQVINKLLEGVDKPARYIGGEVNSVVKEGDHIRRRIALCFPDVYEVAESHIGLKILYDIINKKEDMAAERVYAMWPDLEKKARENNVPIWSLESRLPLKVFDMVGFTLQYELSYPTLIGMLEHGGVPVRAKDRTEDDPYVIGGGAGSYNPEPIAPFFDALLLGDGEEAIIDIVDAIDAAKSRNATRQEVLEDIARIPGMYVPSHFEMEYDGVNITKIEALEGSSYKDTRSKHGTPRITRRTVIDLDGAHYPTRPIIPNIKPVHERASIEIQRGCSQACRFCQAGMITRPTRQRKPETVLKLAEAQIKNSGADELGLLSLSAGDYEPINYVLEQFFDRFSNQNVSVSLPSMRTETMTPKLAEQVATVRKSGFTFAPEAGSERMRRVINKTNSEEDLMNAVRATVKAGWRHLKFYFMIGLPTETFVDVEAIAHLGERARAEGRKIRKDINVTVSVSTFVPKPHTSFQWEAQIGVEETLEKQRYLRRRLKRQNIGFRWHSAEQSFLEGVLSRGDRRLADALEIAAREGCRLDAWSEQHNSDQWLEVLERTLTPHGLEASEYLEERPMKGILPWDHLDAGILKKFLMRDRKASLKEATIEDCALHDYCYACGGCDKGAPYNKQKGEDGKRLVALAPVVEKEGTFEKRSSLRVIGQDVQDVQEPVEAAPPVNETTRLRMRFAKLGRAVHQSHLDMREFILRAMRLAGLELRYSQGNTPRPKVSFSPACPTGVQSEAEYMDVDCIGDADARAVAEKIRPYLPDGIFIINGEEIGLKSPSINSALCSTSYKASFGEALSHEELREKAESFMNAQEVLVKVIRKSKGRFLDARENVLDIAVVGQSLHIKLGFTNNGATMKVYEALGAVVGVEMVKEAQITKVSAEIGEESLGAPPIAPLVVEDCVDVVDLTTLSVRARQGNGAGRSGKGSAILVPYAE